jgi:hypothetical protein
MFKKIAFILFLLLFASSFAFSEETFKISGQIHFQYAGDIHVCLLKMEDLRDFTRPHHELSQSPCKVIPMNGDLERAGKVSFTFDDVSQGTYCLLTYQDLNSNGEVDFVNYAIDEPWGSYKPFGNLIWQKIKFNLRKDMDGIQIDM